MTQGCAWFADDEYLGYCTQCFASSVERYQDQQQQKYQYDQQKRKTARSWAMDLGHNLAAVEVIADLSILVVYVLVADISHPCTCLLLSFWQ